MRHKEGLSLPIWEPSVYNKLAIAQRTAVLKVLEHLNIEKTSHILDVGCGDGKISAELAKIAEDGRVLGVDRSCEMIDFAIGNYKSIVYPNLQFLLQDAKDINFSEEFDIVFSSFALQWIKDKNEFFTKANAALKEDGQICIICPLAVSPELDLVTEGLIENPQWAGFYTDFHPGWYFVNREGLSHLIKEACFVLKYSHTYIQEVEFQSKNDFEKYVLLWYPYLAPLEDSLKTVFFTQVIDEYCKLLPPTKTGAIRMRIPTAFFVADKISL